MARLITRADLAGKTSYAALQSVLMHTSFANRLDAVICAITSETAVAFRDRSGDIQTLYPDTITAKGVGELVVSGMDWRTRKRRDYRLNRMRDVVMVPPQGGWKREGEADAGQ